MLPLPDALVRNPDDDKLQEGELDAAYAEEQSRHRNLAGMAKTEQQADPLHEKPAGEKTEQQVQQKDQFCGQFTKERHGRSPCETASYRAARFP